MITILVVAITTNLLNYTFPTREIRETTERWETVVLRGGRPRSGADAAPMERRLKVTDKWGTVSGPLLWHNKVDDSASSRRGAYHLWSQRGRKAAGGTGPRKSPGRPWRNLCTADRREKVRFQGWGGGSPCSRTGSHMGWCALYRTRQ